MNFRFRTLLRLSLRRLFSLSLKIYDFINYEVFFNLNLNRSLRTEQVSMRVETERKLAKKQRKAASSYFRLVQSVCSWKCDILNIITLARIDPHIPFKKTKQKNNEKMLLLITVFLLSSITNSSKQHSPFPSNPFPPSTDDSNKSISYYSSQQPKTPYFSQQPSQQSYSFHVILSSLFISKTFFTAKTQSLVNINGNSLGIPSKIYNSSIFIY